MHKLLPILALTTLLHAEESSESYDRIPPSPFPTRLPAASLGVAFTSSYKTLYLFRGYQLSEQVWENHFSTAVSLSNDFALDLEALYLHGFANNSMSQSALGAELQYFINDNLIMGYRIGGEFFSNAFMQNSIDHSLNWHYSFNLSWNLNAQILWSDASAGWYYVTNFTYQPLITTRTAWATTIQLSAVTHYQGDSGLHEVSLRTGPIIRINELWICEPFMAAGHYFNDERRQHFFGGISFTFQF